VGTQNHYAGPDGYACKDRATEFGAICGGGISLCIHGDVSLSANIKANAVVLRACLQAPDAKVRLD
jgi:hypothetical protein